MSWHGPSAPRVEGIATKSLVVASCASKPASTASRILCLWSLAFIASWFLRGTVFEGRSNHTLARTPAPCTAFRIAGAPIQSQADSHGWPKGPKPPDAGAQFGDHEGLS